MPSRLNKLSLNPLKTFLCYPSEAEKSAREVTGFVRSVGIDCWFDKDSLVAGEDWDRSRRDALQDADVVLVLCSSVTTGRNGVYQREINEALQLSADRRLGNGSAAAIPKKKWPVAGGGSNGPQVQGGECP